jgi:hypothetical protein
MVVEIINVTDGPNQDPQQVQVYSKTLAPGESIKIPAELVDERLRQLAEGDHPQIAIGQAPSWYLASKIRRGKELTAEEIQRRYSSRLKKPEPVAVTPPKLEIKEEPRTLMFQDSLSVEDDITPFERKSHKKRG